MVFTIRATIEVLGYPEEHIKEVINKVIEKLKTEEGIKVLKETTHETEKIKDTIFASFVEIELKINDFSKLLSFCYDYLPSTMEILDTEKIALPVREFSAGINEMLINLHNYKLVLNNLSQKIKEKNITSA